MAFRTSLFLLPFFAIVAGHAEPIVKQPYRGVKLKHELLTSPRNLAVNTLIVDLQQPGIGLLVTPSNGVAANETNLQTTLNFLTTNNVQLAVNAHFFSPVSSEGTPADVLGLAASNGDVYSPAQTGFPSFVIRAGNVPVVVTPEQSLPADVQQAVSGDFQIITAGANTGNDTGPTHEMSN